MDLSSTIDSTFHTTASDLRGLRPLLPWIVCCLLTAVGCDGTAPQFTEFKRIDEQITESELQTFLRILQALPEKRLPALPSVFDTSAAWDCTRNQPINKLVDERESMLGERWSVRWLSDQLEADRTLDRLLRREKMTREQFVGFALAIGVAVSRSKLRETQDLSAILTRGVTVVEQLRRNPRPFSELTDEGMYHVLQQAVWISRVDRAKHLKLVPAENVALVGQYITELQEVLPDEFTTNPLDPLADRLDAHGVPFEEMAETGRDDAIQWNSAEAIVGTDSPDPEFVRPTKTKRLGWRSQSHPEN